MKTRASSITSICLSMLLSGGMAAAQIGEPVQNNLAGNWVPLITMDYTIRGAGPNWGAYEGVPINAEARDAALSFTPDTLTQLWRQCEPWSAHYLLLGPFGMQIWPTVDSTSGSTVAWHIGGSLDRMPITIWMDGRPSPSSQALHSYEGFASGQWRGQTLVALITHLKDGFLTRNGIPASNQETIRLFLTRHDDLLSLTYVIRDPVYLTAPYVRSGTFRSEWVTQPQVQNQGETVRPMTCMPEEENPGLSDGYHISRFLPGTNRLEHDETKLRGIPSVAALGGEQTMYPEFKAQLAGAYKPPAGFCTTSCCGTNYTGQFNAKSLKCGRPGFVP
jgi:hypothetical protein